MRSPDNGDAYIAKEYGNAALFWKFVQFLFDEMATGMMSTSLVRSSVNAILFLY